LEQEGHLNSESLFRVMFIEQKVSMQTLSLHGLGTSLLPGEGDEATELSINTADLIFEMREEGDAILVSFFYKMDLFEAQTISHLLERFQRLLEQITSRPEQLISELSVP
jgi:hypothetical protein